MDEQSDPPGPRFDDPNVVEAVRWYAELATVHGVKPIFPGEDPSRPETTAWDNRQSLVNSGRVALWSRISGGPFSDLPDDFNVGVAPLPLSGGKIGGWVAEGYYVSRSTLYPQQCWEWIKFLSDHSLEVVEGVPARRSAVESPDFFAKAGEERAQVFLFSMAHLDGIHHWYQTPALNQSYYWFIEAFARAVERKDPGTALAEAQGKAEAFIACLASRDDLTNEEAQKACAREADPDYRGWYEE